MKNIANRL